MDVFLWVIVPYLCLAVFAVGHFWRYRYDKFGWTTRSSQLYEDRLLRLGSPLFHFGMLGVVGGHVIGLLVPRSWTEAVGIDDHLYHYVAVIGGLIAFLFIIGRSFAAKKFGHFEATSAIVTSYYWHFVDVVWIGLFFTIYVIK